MDLNEIRSEIDKIDDELVRLFCQRMHVAAQVADYKKANNLPIFQPPGNGQSFRTWRKRLVPKWPITPGCCTPCCSS